MELKEKVVEVIEDFKKSCDSNNKFVDSMLFIALDEQQNAIPSININVLDNAKEAIVILARYERAIERSHYWYYLKHIDREQIMHDDFRQGDLRISTYMRGSYDNQLLGLSIIDKALLYDVKYSHHENVMKVFKSLWEVFQFVKDFKTEEEIRWAAKFFITNRDLVAAKEKLSFAEMQERFLQKQLNQLNQCVDEIKSIIEGKKNS